MTPCLHCAAPIAPHKGSGRPRKTCRGCAHPYALARQNARYRASKSYRAASANMWLSRSAGLVAIRLVPR